MSDRIKNIKLHLGDSIIPFLIVSLGMFIIQLVFMSNLLPWFDEIMFVDTPIHFLSGDGWTTHTWRSQAGEEPMSLYMPLYQFLLTGWMWVFGTSLWACRSLNLFLTILIGVGLIKLAQRLEINIGKGGAIILALLLWCTPAMSFMYRNGRCDLTGAFFCVILFIQVIDYIKGASKKKWTIILFAGLIMMAGLQAVVYSTMIFLLGIVLLKDQRKPLFHSFLWAIVGYIIGFSITALFFLINGRLLAFFELFFGFSTAIRALAAKLFPYFGPILGLDSEYYMSKLLQSNTMPAPSLAERLLNIVQNPSYMILLLVCIIMLCLSYKKIKQSNYNKSVFALLLLGVLIPVLMNIAGRFVSYYYWMAFLPLMLCASVLFETENMWYKKSITILAIVVLSIMELRVITENSHYKTLRTFIKESPFLKGKVIASPSITIYEVEPLSNKVYYPANLAENDLPSHFDYIIIPQCNNVADKKILQLFETVQSDKSLEVSLVSVCQEPYLEIYEIKSISQ